MRYSMTTKREDEDGTAISVGDGSLGGPGVGGSFGAPGAGVIRDPVGPSVAAPIATDPEEAGVREDPTVDPAALPPESEQREDTEDQPQRGFGS
jgi:hypothetical protein